MELAASQDSKWSNCGVAVTSNKYCRVQVTVGMKASEQMVKTTKGTAGSEGAADVQEHLPGQTVLTGEAVCFAS